MDDEPLVEFGFLEVTLALVAVGFVMADSDNQVVSDSGARVFIASGLSSLLLYFVYVTDWFFKNVVNAPRVSIFRRLGVLMVMCAHGFIFVSLMMAFQGLYARVTRNGSVIRSPALYMLLALYAFLFFLLSRRRS